MSVSEQYLVMMNQWMILKQNNISLEKYFVKRNVKNIIIYGEGIYGRHLVRELKMSSVTVSCLIDRDPKQAYMGIPIIRLGEDFESGDLIVNTVISDSEKVIQDLTEYTSIQVVGLEDIVFKLAEEEMINGI